MINMMAVFARCYVIWDTSELQREKHDTCALRRLKSACAAAHSKKYTLSARRNFTSLAIRNAPSEDSYQTALKADLKLHWAHISVDLYGKI